MSRRWLAPEDAADLGRLDPEAIARVRSRSLARRRERRRAARRAGLARLPDRRGGCRRSRAGASGWRQLAREKRVGSGCIDATAATPLDRRRAPAAVPGALARREARAGDRRPDRHMPSATGRAEEALVEILRGRLEGWGRSRRQRSAAPLGLDADGHRRRARGARGRRLRACAAASRRSGSGGRMVRAPAARAHPPLHGQAPARRDRAGRRARLPALPVRLAARRAGCAHGGAGRARDPGRPARRLRGAGRRLGDRDPAGAPRRL